MLTCFSLFLFFSCRYAKNLRLYFQEYARTLIESQLVNSDGDGDGDTSVGEGNEYQTILAAGSNDSNKPQNINTNISIILSEKNNESPSNINTESPSKININKNIISSENEEKEGDKYEDEKKKKENENEKDKIITSLNANTNIITSYGCKGSYKAEGKVNESVIPSLPVPVPVPLNNPWKHFEPFFKWLDPAENTPEVNTACSFILYVQTFVGAFLDLLPLILCCSIFTSLF
jgi:hypothetical protein